jgi:hypothetical protein
MNVHAGPPRAMTRLTLRLVPLTPLHIGDGTSLWPDEYFIETSHAAAPSDDEEDPPGQRATPTLCHFDQTAAMRAMTFDQRSALSRALDSGRLDVAAQVLRKAGTQCVTQRIPLSSASASELRKAIDDPRARRG